MCPILVLIIFMGKREFVTLLCLSSWCLVIVVWIFSASLAFYLFSPTRLINSIKNEHPCKIIYISGIIKNVFRRKKCFETDQSHTCFDSYLIQITCSDLDGGTGVLDPSLKNHQNIWFLNKNSKYDQEIPQSQTADKIMALRGHNWSGFPEKQNQHSMLGHHRPASKTPFQWRFAGGPIMARFSCILILSPLIK